MVAKVGEGGLRIACRRDCFRGFTARLVLIFFFDRLVVFCVMLFGKCRGMRKVWWGIGKLAAGSRGSRHDQLVDMIPDKRMVNIHGLCD